MGLASKEKMMPLVMVALCIVIGAVSLLLTVYYANSVNNQNQSRNEIANLQTQNTNLQNQIASGNSQISSLNAQVNTLSADKQNLQAQLNTLSGKADDLTSQLDQVYAAVPQRGGAPASHPQ